MTKAIIIEDGAGVEAVHGQKNKSNIQFYLKSVKTGAVNPRTY